MKTILYFASSLLEWISLMLLIFAMFKFKLRGYLGQIALTAGSMSFISHYIFQVIEQRELATILQPVAIFLFLWQVFRIHIFYAALMSVYGYLCYIFIQYLLLAGMLYFGIPMEILVPRTLPVYLLVTITIAVVLLVVTVLYKFRMGYSFVPDSEYVPFKFSGMNIKLLLMIVAGYVVLTLTNYVVFEKNSPTQFILLTCLILGIMLHFAQRKEEHYD